MGLLVSPWLFRLSNLYTAQDSWGHPVELGVRRREGRAGQGARVWVRQGPAGSEEAGGGGVDVCPRSTVAPTAAGARSGSGHVGGGRLLSSSVGVPVGSSSRIHLSVPLPAYQALGASWLPTLFLPPDSVLSLLPSRIWSDQVKDLFCRGPCRSEYLPHPVPLNLHPCPQLSLGKTL